MTVRRYFVACIIALLCASVSAVAQLQVASSIPPQATLLKKLGGEAVEVVTVLKSGANPHTYEPTPGQIRQLRTVDIYFKTGMEFEEALLPKLKKLHPQMEVVDLREGLDLLEMECTHSHGDHHHHEHGVDQHIWLSAPLLQKQVERMASVLSAKLPEQQKQISERQALLNADLVTVHTDLSEKLAALRGKSIYVYHPAFAYLCRDYGMKQVAVELGGKEATPRHLQSLIEQARADGVRVIFAQPQYNPRTAQILAESLGAQVLLIDDLAKDPISNLREIARLLAQKEEVTQ